MYIGQLPLQKFIKHKFTLLPRKEYFKQMRDKNSDQYKDSFVDFKDKDEMENNESKCKKNKKFHNDKYKNSCIYNTKQRKKVVAINVFQDCMIALCILALPFIFSVLLIINFIYEKIKYNKITKEDEYNLPASIILAFLLVVFIACGHLNGKNRLKNISFEDFK